ncbi:MAG: ROK family protein [Caldilineae bacterium]|nr:MAG: ROK family protein [Caldilineae bacterium]
MSASQQYYIGIDLGGTKILAAVVDETGKIHGRAKRKTVPAKMEGDPPLIADRIARTAREAMEEAGLVPEEIAAIGASAPGPVDIQKGRVYRAVNLPNWEKPYDLGPELQKRLGRPVVVDNDVNVGTLGEATYGAARGFDDVIGIFVGTGIGGGVILDGKLRRGFRWAAGEIGHMVMHCHDELSDVESFASRGAISRRLEEALAQGKAKKLAQVLAKRQDRRITSGVIRRALKAGDSATQEAVAEAQHILGLLIVSVVNLLDPQCIVLGGGLVESLGESFVEPIRSFARSHFFLQEGADRIQIVQAELGDDAGVLGAAVLAQTMLARE